MPLSQGQRAKPYGSHQREFMLPLKRPGTTQNVSLWALFDPVQWDEFVILWRQMAEWYFEHTAEKYAAYAFAGVSKWAGSNYLNMRQNVSLRVANLFLEFYYAHV